MCTQGTEVKLFVSFTWELDKINGQRYVPAAFLSELRLSLNMVLYRNIQISL
jgi:hypothetical protein